MPEGMKKLYLSAFPPEERRPVHLLDHMIFSPASPVNLFLIEEENKGGSPSGFMTLWQFPDGTRYIEHLATLPERRGNGLGALAISEAERITANGKPLVIEVEKPENDMASRRISFYQRCGFKLHDNFRYIQPPYSPALPAVELLLMTKGDSGEIDLAAITADLHHFVYGVEK